MYEMKQACYIHPLKDAGQDGGSVRLSSADIRYLWTLLERMDREYGGATEERGRKS